MQKGSSSSTFVRRFSNNKRNVFILLGGVLLCCLFALVPNSVFAFSNSIYPSSDSHFSSFSARVGVGCILQNYDLFPSNANFVGGGSYNNSWRSCGFTMSNGSLTQREQLRSNFYSSIEYNGETFSRTSDTFNSTYHNTNYDGSPKDLAPALTGFRVKGLPSGVSGGDLKLNESNPVFVYAFKYNSNWFPTGLVPRISSAEGSNINILDEYNRDISDEYFNDTQTYRDLVIDQINKSMLFVCSDDHNPIDDISGFPDNLRSEFSDYTSNSCVLSFSYDFTGMYYVVFQNYTFDFIYPASDYTWEYKTSLIDSELLPEYAYSFGGLANGLVYGNIGNVPVYTRFIPIDPKFIISIPSNTDERTTYYGFYNSSLNSHDSLVNLTPSSTPNEYDSSSYMGWFNIFGFGLGFPFVSLFSSFTGGNTCVNVPIIAIMINAPSSEYCSWFSSDIRNILTPVIGIVSIMLVFGFIIRWLSRSDKIALGGK